MRSGSRALALAVLAVFAIACSDDPQPSNGQGQDTSTGGGPTFNADTGGGGVVAEDVGTEGCSADADCSEPTAHCDEAAGKCVQCLVEQHCPVGHRCDGGGCLPKSCKAGDVTCKDGATLAKCNAKGDGFELTPCGAGKVCHDKKCRAIACKPGDAKCATDGRAVLVCNEFGTTLVKKPCSSTETCFAAKCKPHICKPGKKVCEGTKSVKTCTADGLNFTTESCNDGSDGKPAQSCDPGYGTSGAQAFCANQLCKSGQLFCADNQAKQCSKDGLTAEVKDNCNLNAASGAPRICDKGACIDLKCKPGALACLTWASVGKCKQDGQGWHKVSCGDNAVCQGGKCITQACNPAKTFCQGTVVKKCNSFGTGAAFVSDCAQSGQKCFKGSCSKVICTQGHSKCSADAKLLMTCGTGGYEFVAKNCGLGFTCLAKTGTTAQCVKKICEPTKKFCDGKQPKQCNGYGTAASILPGCTGATFCHAGTCKKKVCTPGEFKCKNAQTLQQCNTLGVAWDVVGCGGGQVCGAKQCKKKTCDPGKALCVGTVAKGCDSTGLKWAFVKDCAKSQQSCQNGNCIKQHCGDGTCNKGTETCKNCEKDCGKCPPDGCSPLPSAGCSNCPCQKCVCDLDPFCCTGLWTATCALICKNCANSTCGS